MKIAVLKETAEHEKRVAATPESVKKLLALGYNVSVEKDAGTHASFSDSAYKAAGAKIAKTASECVKSADIVLKVQRPSEKEAKLAPKGSFLIATMAPHKSPKDFQAYAKAGVNVMAMEYMPRITRAQSMDILSSQANLAGYKSVLDAAAYYGRAFPMMMTAAGTIPPARVMVMGAGVAGLQAIATAKRLGAVVSATDVRLAAKEQVESLGANFVMVEDDEAKEAETSGGYAKEMSKAYQKKQAALIAETLKKQDIAITTALIPGRPAPVLINEDMVKSMKPGSVIVDLAVEQGGNCTLSEYGKVVEKHGITIIGHANVPSRLASDASQLYARNLYNFIAAFTDQDKKAFSVNWDDEIIQGVALTKSGKVVHPNFAKPKKAATKKKTTTKRKAPKKKTGTGK